MTAAAPSHALPLAGHRILVTRPQPAAQALAARITRAGGQALLFPTLEIAAVPASPDTLAALRSLQRCRLAIFVSANAVRHGMPLVRDAGGWPPTLRAAAIGTATAELLCAAGIADVLAPEAGADSEALLARPELQHVAGWSVVVFRGVGGRELLAETLVRRGATVLYAECYRRTVPASDPRAVQAALDGGALDAVVAASAEGTRNLLELLGPRHTPALLRVPLVVPHGNVAQAARKLGFEDVHVAGDAHQGVIDCLARLPARHS